MNKNAISLITYKPNEIMLEFFNRFTNYDVYIIIDDNTVNYSNLGNKYSNLKIIQFSLSVKRFSSAVWNSDI